MHTGKKWIEMCFKIFSPEKHSSQNQCFINEQSMQHLALTP